ncbi:Aminoacid dehydrogenase-like protein [Fragilariopsis cylindrus CCMP1102]|uniref:Aminoacid dehydrogenase-like protein n=1 Tax=Fragilariopsis cylindrus CCMP1102 TaxID=635003 RepID=A0A1E7F994_9STRA|nr:Aminoacid dehydrogenase-like protein [Fragilariopsis cylindrus CCMP1102]|eukprot:OEU14704.1 Aminoacid dehydrogenase-like protein [Fragilariopsis cylindrus CCMP1102]
MEAANLLIREAKRRDEHEHDYIDSVTSIMQCLSPVFDRNPKYAFVAKTLIEPERSIQFRVAWIDDVGVNRLNRGFRMQYSSSLGPYAGSLHLGSTLTHNVAHALAFDTVFSNAVTGFNLGAASGGSDFDPLDKSEAELQRFCQSYSTELAKYIGPEVDIPFVGMGCGKEEMGYIYGQYKRIKPTGNFMSNSDMLQAPGFTVVHFANRMLQDRGDSLQGKRVMITGSGRTARSVAKKCLEYGAIPITMTDTSGHIYEPDGIPEGKLAILNKIKEERGALLGRYIISSTTAEFNHPENLFDIPCDICIPCGAMKELDKAEINALADNGCKFVIEGGQSCVTPSARKVLKKRGLLYGPHTMTMTGPAITYSLGSGATDDDLKREVDRIYNEVKMTATEFNSHRDLYAGANIAGFLRVAKNMMLHGAV